MTIITQYILRKKKLKYYKEDLKLWNLVYVAVWEKKKKEMEHASYTGPDQAKEWPAPGIPSVVSLPIYCQKKNYNFESFRIHTNI